MNPATSRSASNRPVAASTLPGALELFRKAVELPLVWQERIRMRHHLAEMPDHLLRDIGLSRADVDHEATKWFWRP